MKKLSLLVMTAAMAFTANATYYVALAGKFGQDPWNNGTEVEAKGETVKWENKLLGQDGFKIKVWDSSASKESWWQNATVTPGEWTTLSDGSEAKVKDAGANDVFDVEFNVTTHQVLLTKVEGGDTPVVTPTEAKYYLHHNLGGSWTDTEFNAENNYSYTADLTNGKEFVVKKVDNGETWMGKGLTVNKNGEAYNFTSTSGNNSKFDLATGNYTVVMDITANTITFTKNEGGNEGGDEPVVTPTDNAKYYLHHELTGSWTDTEFNAENNYTYTADLTNGKEFVVKKVDNGETWMGKGLTVNKNGEAYNFTSTSGNNSKFDLESGNYTVVMDVTKGTITFTKNNGGNVDPIDPVDPEVKTVTITVAEGSTYNFVYTGEATHVYAWIDGTETAQAAWPGVEMKTVMVDGKAYKLANLDEKYNMVKFNKNGNDNGYSNKNRAAAGYIMNDNGQTDVKFVINYTQGGEVDPDPVDETLTYYLRGNIFGTDSSKWTDVKMLPQADGTYAAEAPVYTGNFGIKVFKGTAEHAWFAGASGTNTTVNYNNAFTTTDNNTNDLYINMGEDGGKSRRFEFNPETKELLFTAATGVETVAADDAEAVYFNLQGVRVDNPAKGLYIVVKGNKTAKVIL